MSSQLRSARLVVATVVAIALAATIVVAPPEVESAAATGTPVTVAETSYEPSGFATTPWLNDGSTVASITTANSHGGDWSYSLESQLTGYWVGMSETLTGLTVGRSYTLSAWVDASGTSGLSGIGIGADGIGYSSATTSGWQAIDYTFTAVASTQDWSFGHNDASPTSGGVFWDDLAVTQDGYLDGSGWHSPEVLQSQDYEMGGFATEPWLNDGSTVATISTANSRTGDWSFGLRSQLTGYWVGMSDTLTGLEDGKEYTLSAWVNISGTSGLSDVSLDVHGIGKDTATVGGWQQLSYTFMAEGATQDWSLGHNDASPTSGTVYWDDVSLTTDEEPDSFTWPVVEVSADPSYTGTKGITVLSEEPLLQLIAYDEDAEAPLSDMDFEVRIEDEAEQLVIDDLTTGTHVYGFQYVEWALPTGTLEDGATYTLLIRLHSDTDDGPWSPGTRLHVGTPMDPPTLVSPVENAVVLPNVQLQADVGDEEDADVAFRIEANWGGGSPIEVATGTAQTDSSGVAVFAPDLNLNPFQEIHLRWQAIVQGDGYSEWSDYEEFTVSSLPSAVYAPSAIQNRNSVHVTWGFGSYLSYAPPTGYTVTLLPDNIIIEVPATPRVADFAGLEIGDYEIAITPHNLLGDGPTSNLEVEVGAYSPSEPLDVMADVELTDATVSWSPPADLGGGVIDHYNVTLYTPFCDDPRSETTTDEFFDFEDLLEGCLYYALISAETADGAGSPGFAEFYAYGLPFAPTEPELRAGDGYVDVYWTASDSNGSPVTSYTVTINPGATEVIVPVTGTWPRVAARIEGLSNATAYTFTVGATNAAGTGATLAAGSLAPSENTSDQDLDGLVDAAEAILGTNPLLSDTDADGLTDFDEVRLLTGATDPLLADTDGDSVDDNLADADGDGISNAGEILAGTNPTNVDSDVDGLSDDQEVLAGTDPLASDTDEDGLTDSSEIANGTNPTSADSDSDSEPDDEELVARDIASNPDYAPDGENVAIASVSGPDGSVSSVTVEQGSAVEFPGAVTFSAMVNAGTEPDTEAFARGISGLDPPTVTSLKIHYAIPVSTVSNLRPIRWNVSLNRWEFVSNNLTVSTADNTIVIDSPELGVRYAVVNLDEWRNNANQCYLAENGKPRLDVEMIVDATSSMEDNDPTGERFDAMRTVIGALRPGDRVSVRQFGVVGVLARGGAGGSGNFYLPDTWLESWPTSPNGVTLTPAEAMSLINLMEVNAATDSTIDEWDSSLISWGLIEQAIGGINAQGDWLREGEFKTDSAACRLHTVLLVTDGSARPTGLPNWMNVPGYVDFRDRTDPVHVLDVGVGSPTTAVWLEQLASDTGGTYSYVPTETDLNSWIEDVLPYNWSLPISDTLDTDGDGVPDKIEIRGVVDTASRKDAGMPARYTSDPYEADTDGDGMPDGMEIGSRPSASQLGLPGTFGSLAFYVKSDPASSDGDGDFMPDINEVEDNGRPLIADIDNDGADDGTELAWGTDPNKADTDGDGKLDGEEIANYYRGDDPFTAPIVTTPLDIVREFQIGLLLGELMYIPDSIPWLVGDLVSGFIPGLPGVIADIRDALGQLARVELLGAVISIIAIIPAFGDGIRAIAVLSKAAIRASKSYFRNFVLSIADDRGILDDVVEKAIGEIDPNLQSKLNFRDVDNDARNFALKYVSPTHLKNILDSDNLIPAYRPNGLAAPVIRTNDWRETGRLGERYFLDTMGYPNYRQEFDAPGVGVARFYDLVINTGLEVQYREFKTGYTRLSNPAVAVEFEKDADLAASGATVIWSFAASGATGIGPDPKLLAALNDSDILFEIHWPDEGF